MMNRKIPLFIAALGLGLSLNLGVDGCTDVPSTCQTVCSELWLCGMIPGPLGNEELGRGTIEDCQARCAISSNSVDLSRCIDDNLSDRADEIWCDNGRCSQFASCLRTSLESDYILGVGTVRLTGLSTNPEAEDDEPSGSNCLGSLEVATGTGTDGNSSGGGGGGVDCPTTQDSFEDQAFLGEICSPKAALMFLGPEETSSPYEIVPGRVILELVSDQAGTFPILDGECDSLQSRLEVPNVPTGTYRTQLRMFSEESNNCVLFEGAMFSVTTQDTHKQATSTGDREVLGTRAQYWIDASGMCQLDARDATDTCPSCDAVIAAAKLSDQAARETALTSLLGITALAEPEQCPEAEFTRCQDGIDNDGDDLVDCDDQDCQASGACDGTQITTSSVDTSDASTTGGDTSGTGTTGGSSTGGGSTGGGSTGGGSTG